MSRHTTTLKTIYRLLLFRWLQMLAGKDAYYKANIYGYSVNLSLNEQIQKTIALGLYEIEESKWIEQILQPGMTFVDVGANIGYYSLLAASRVGVNGKVICFEPSPYCYDKLEKTAQKNRISQIIVERFALGDSIGNLELVVENEKLHSPSFLAKSGDRSYLVPVNTLDSYAQTSQIDSIDILKIDVEGFEPNVIHGATQTLNNGKVRHIFCELNEVWLGKNSSSSKQLDELIISFGFFPVETKNYEYHKNILYAKRNG